jgi:hypothetical protein
MAENKATLKKAQRHALSTSTKLGSFWRRGEGTPITSISGQEGSDDAQVKTNDRRPFDLNLRSTGPVSPQQAQQRRGR